VQRYSALHPGTGAYFLRMLVWRGLQMGVIALTLVSVNNLLVMH
jgi:uncharacterized protein YqhQ